MPNSETFIAEFDGGSRGNPGPAGIGIVVRAADGTPLITLGRFIGRATSNFAEYRGLIAALAEARRLGARKILIRGDSELIIKQMRGEYRVRHPDLKPLHDEAQALIQQFDEFSFVHNLRHKNELADKLANRAMDRRGDVTDDGDLDLSIKSAPKDSGVDENVYACSHCGCEIQVRRSSNSESNQPFGCQCGNDMKPVD